MMNDRFYRAMGERYHTYATLSRAAKVSVRTLSNIRQGKAVSPRIAFRVARALGGKDARPEAYGITVTGHVSCPST